MESKKALAVLPAGTMNLFARSLQIPQRLDLAVEAFANAEVRAVDMATANGRPFVHQFSIGLHAKMVHLRDKMEYRSRFGKIGASFRAAYHTVMSPPSLRVELRIDGRMLLRKTSGIGVSNNLFGEGHLPYADVPDDGVLGVYVTLARTRTQILGHGINMMRGRWRNNEHVEMSEAKEVEIKILGNHRKFSSVIDGELYKLDPVTNLRVLPGALRVLVPTAATKAVAA